MAAIPLVIDTDPALGIWHEGRPRDVDDGLAIVEALNEPRFELLGITVTFGNAPLQDAFKVANDLVRLKKSSVPVLSGAANAMPQTDDTPAEETDAVRFLRHLTRRRRIRIAAIGPLTNLGVLLSRYPEAAQNIDEVVIVAGRSQGRGFYLGKVGPVRDFNFENDVHATEILLASGIPVVMAGFELSSVVVVTAEDLVTIGNRGTASAEYLHRNSLDWFKHWTKTFPTDAGFHPWDSAAIAWLLRPDLFATERRGVRIRSVDLNPIDRARNPDGSPTQVPWLETSTDFAHSDDPQVTYCTGFTPGKAAEFVAAMMAGIY